MSSAPDSSPDPNETPSLLRRDGWPVVGIMSATAAVQVAIFLIPLSYGVPAGPLAAASLIIAGVWVATASAVFAAGPNSALSGVLRGGCVADATVVLLLVLWRMTPVVTFTAAVKIYCIYASVSLCAAALVRVARTARVRYLCAVIAATALTAIQAGLFWLPGLLQLFEVRSKSAVAGLWLRANPLYGAFSAIAEESRFVWHYAELMYRITPLGEDIAVPSVQWWEPMAIHLVLAAGVAAWSVVGRRRLDYLRPDVSSER